MLYLVGLGLGDVKDITVAGLEIVRTCSRVYLEAYTSILTNSNGLEAFYGVPIEKVDRHFVESGCEEMLELAKKDDVAFLVVGDPFGATTHSDLQLRALSRGVGVRAIHNASIMNAIGCTGMQLYRFGQTVSIPYFEKDWRPRSFVDKININLRNNFHTLVLLDIKMHEQSVENMMKGNDVFEPPRFMTVNDAIEQLLSIEEDNDCSPSTKAIGVARIGSTDSQCVISGTLSQLKEVDFGGPLHSLVICAPELHDIESEFFEYTQFKR